VVADQALASQLAEIGDVLLMVGVDMHFHPRERLRAWRVALPGEALDAPVAAAIVSTPRQAGITCTSGQPINFNTK
jgi:predicted Kef-type K+ transport protein